MSRLLDAILEARVYTTGRIQSDNAAAAVLALIQSDECRDAIKDVLYDNFSTVEAIQAALIAYLTGEAE